jgi:hypothetical protein
MNALPHNRCNLAAIAPQPVRGALKSPAIHPFQSFLGQGRFESISKIGLFIRKPLISALFLQNPPSSKN